LAAGGCRIRRRRRHAPRDTAFSNSGEFEGCGPNGYLSLQLNGERDGATLKKATLALVQLVQQRI
jgi:hypothetical protein